MNHGTIRNSGSPSGEPTLTPTARVLRMRCPCCSKMYSVEESWVRAAPTNALGNFATPLRFECVDCKTRFEVVRPTADGALLLSTRAIPLTPVMPAAALKTPIRVAPKAQPASIASQNKCPKCGVRTPDATAKECQSCGVVFARFKPLVEGATGEIRLDGYPELNELWEDVMLKYEDEARHERFLEACRVHGQLAFASQKYARILSASSHEDIAKRMRRKIIGFASYEAVPRTTGWSYNFRIPGFNGLVLALGGATMTTGLMLPGMKNLTGIGVASIALAVGLRFFLRPKED